MKAVLLSSDLMVVSRVQGAATRAGVAVRAVLNAEQAVASCAEERAEVLIVDLATSPLDLVSMVNSLRADESRPMHVVAFGPHVHEERLAAAREAGCNLVVSRGKFFAEIDSILKC